MKITAYNISNPMKIDLPNKKRNWMDETPGSYAYRCLPMTIANGYGWSFINPHKFSVIWNGGSHVKDTIVNEPTKFNFVQSHFGSGIITFNLGILIKTDEGINTYIKGPANNPKRGISPLEGIIETDWMPYTFTMNWKITEPNFEIFFDQGEEICTFFPIKRNFIEEHDPEVKNIQEDPELQKYVTNWGTARETNTKECAFKKIEDKGIRFYLHGKYPDGNKADSHQVNVRAKPFKVISPYMFEYKPWPTFSDNFKTDTPDKTCYDNCCLEKYK